MRKLISITLVCISSLLCFTSCLEDSDETIVLPRVGTVDDAIPNEIRVDFENYMDVYEGINPPNIEGQFLISRTKILYSSDGQYASGGNFADIELRFFKQSGLFCEYQSKQSSNTATSSDVRIVGEGNKFTAYFISNTDSDVKGASSKTSVIISGIISPEGIKNCKYAFIMLDKKDPNNKLMDVNEFRVFYDSDSLASRSTILSGTALRSSDCETFNAKEIDEK